MPGPLPAPDDTAAVARLRVLVGNLPQAAAADAAIVETHISLLLLAGGDAWKFKKPVRLPFADFSAAAERRRLCHAEVALNRHLAPTLYRGVVAVTGSPERPRLGGRGRVLEHAVHMRRFDNADEALPALRDGRLQVDHLRRFGDELAVFHASAEVLPAERPLARAADLDRAWQDDLAVLESLDRGGLQARLTAMRGAWDAELAATHRLLAARRRNGRVRACHGDLHLGNLVLLDGRLTAFDCIEFSDEFRYVDTCNEVAFLVMDLERHARPRLAAAFLDSYLSASGEYSALRLLRLFSAYRASVRAKIAALRLAQKPSPIERRRARADVDAYLASATDALTAPPAAPMVLMHGLSGSGKSWLAAALAAHAGLLCVRSDVERRRLYDVSTARGRRLAYRKAGVRRTYDRLLEQCRHALRAGRGVIADATFLDAAERRRFANLAGRLGVPFAILDAQAPQALLEQRVCERDRRGDDPSQADLEVLAGQQRTLQPLSGDELSSCVTQNTARVPGMARLWRRLQAVSQVPEVPPNGL